MANEMQYQESYSNLIRRVCMAQNGDAEAFATLVERFQGMGFAVAYDMLNTTQLAEDALQEAFLAAYRELHKLREPAAFPSWFRRLVVKYSDRLIRNKSLPTAPYEDALNVGVNFNDPAQTYEKIEQLHALRTALHTLPSSQRLPITLYYLHGYSQQAIADFLGLPVSTVKKRVFDARQQLKETILMNEKPQVSSDVAARVNFFVALKTRDLAKIKKLVDQNPALLNAQTTWGEASEGYYWPLGVPPTVWAAAIGDLKLLKMLMDKGADIHVLTDNGGSRTLFHAIGMQQVEMVAFLLDQGVAVNAHYYADLTPAHHAVLVENIDILKLLIEHGADLSLVDKSGHSPADWAAMKGNADVLEIFVDEGLLSEVPAAPTTTKSSSRQIQVSSALFNQILNVEGAIMNGAITMEGADYRGIVQHNAPYMLSSGIKIIDGIAPLRRGGQNGIFTPLPGVGKLVVLGQIIAHLRQLYNGVAVSLMLEEGPYTAENQLLCWRSMGVHDQIVQVAVSGGAGVQDMLRGAETALTIADYFREQGHEVLLLVDSKLAMEADVVRYLQANPSITPTSAVTTLYYGDNTPETDPEIFGRLDTLITFDKARAKQGLWPAIDPLRSTAYFLDNVSLNRHHHTLIQQVKQTLQRYHDLGANGDIAELADVHDQQTVLRARRLHHFLTQAFSIAELYTGRPGEIVDLEDSLVGIEAILAGEWDEVAENELTFIGALTQ